LDNAHRGLPNQLKKLVRRLKQRTSRISVRLIAGDHLTSRFAGFVSSKARPSMMKLSARNQIKSKAMKVTKGAATSRVQIDIRAGAVVTGSIAKPSGC
jgi:hypothetical protein